MTDTPTTDIAAAPDKGKHPLLAALDKMAPEMQRALPKHLTGDRIARLTLTLIRQNPKLLQCTPQSFFGALMSTAALGLEPGVNGEAYLVPYEDRKQGITAANYQTATAGVSTLGAESNTSPVSRASQAR